MLRRKLLYGLAPLMCVVQHRRWKRSFVVPGGSFEGTLALLEPLPELAAEAPSVSCDSVAVPSPVPALQPSMPFGSTLSCICCFEGTLALLEPLPELVADAPSVPYDILAASAPVPALSPSIPHCSSSSCALVVWVRWLGSS